MSAEDGPAFIDTNIILYADNASAGERRERASQLPTWVRAGRLHSACRCCSAVSLGCGVVWSEDLNAGQRIAGVTIRNPLLS